MKTQKTPEQLAQERQEARELSTRILSSTDKIPPHILHKASIQKAIAFKTHAAKARKMAETNPSDVVKMREAWNLISGYYQHQGA